ncbi:membrane fusion protein (multidrug efflux system) [Variovorax boronicumulans]|uniref:Membrane fusion protein (Multidrug efflux system) n=1 Tax=Variovorax boronicumulans TaxID=436515 RepID=A0AAW8CR55_9BURK|nr:efflux RND transporter periplasmic adaptor subunit [Variovorax boronicumulans]MDP9891801.1 membrane fusion protein (multidrug efflux system) [Variovorax boronicumulans]MDQ0052974.1 membrane fusion protein (multidrug efflux system) [Variovorax boronicumulans]
MSDNNTPTSAASAAPVAPEAPAGNGKRRRALTALAAVVIVAGGGWGLYEWLVASHYEDTDNAYVQGNVIQITPQIGGTVMAINADDTDFVKAGQPLVQLDPADAKVSLEQAEAALAQTVRQTRTLYANNGSLAAQVTLRQSDIVKAQSDIAKAQDDLQRRRALSGNGAVSKEELNHAETQLDTAKSQLAAAQAGVVAAKEALVSNQSLTEGTSVAQHPSVLAAAAKVREAYLATQRVAMPAPVDGYVAKRTVQLGQRVAAGTPMMSIVPLNQLWVDANFKEVQLRNIRIGQPVKLTADVYGKKVEYDGKVAGLGVGTGSAFALLPAQNATGNWIKVVQRVPVRIALDPEQLKTNPLRIGLSMDAEIDITSKSGKMLADAPRGTALTQTQVYSQLDRGADAEVDRIVAANLGRSASANAANAAGAASAPAKHPSATPGTGAQVAVQGQPG